LRHDLTRFRGEARILLRIGFPVMVGNLLQVSMSTVDTLMAGHLGAQDLAAVALGSSLLMPVLILGIGILMGMSPIIAQHFGAGRIDLVGPTGRHGIVLALVLAVPSVAALWNTGPLLDWMGVDDSLHGKTTGYTRAVSVGIVPMYVYLALKYLNEGMAATRPAMWVALIGLAFNVSGNYVFMYGKLGFPAMGAVGTGVSTALVMTVMGFSMFLYTFLKREYRSFEIFRHFRNLQGSILKELLRVGFPIGMSMWMEVTMFSVVALLIGTMGTMEVAAHQIALNVASVTFMIAFGISSGITVRVGQVFGRSGMEDARYSGMIGIALSAVYMVAMALVMVLVPEWIIGMYTTDTDLVARGVSLLMLAAVFQLSDGLQVSGSGALRGLKDTAIPMVVNFVSYWVIGLPLGWFVGIRSGWGPEGLWIGLILGLSTAAILHNVRFWRISRRQPHP
jgi:multidrug resistance protein, MATE family